MSEDNVMTEGPGREFATTREIVGLMGYLILVAGLLMWGLYTAWPPCKPSPKESEAATLSAGSTPTPSSIPTPSPTPTPSLTPTPVVGGNQTLKSASATPTPSPSPTPTVNNQQPVPDVPSKGVLLLVILAGALGGTVHAIRSLHWYVGNRDLKRSWLSMYLLLPLNGAIIALVFHLIILGGFAPQQPQNNTWLGFVAIAAMVGLFSEQASLKLKDIANAFFTKPGEGKDASSATATASAPKITGIDPNHGQTKGGEDVTITGTGFVETTKVKFGDNPAQDVKFISSSKITARTPPGKQPGKVAVEVINPDNKSNKVADGYSYDPAPGNIGNQG